MSAKIKLAITFLSFGLAASGFWMLSRNSCGENPSPIAGLILSGREKEAKRDVPEASPEKITLLFGGDLMLDRYLRQVAQKKGYDFLFEKLNPILEGNDLNVVNLEGPITENPSLSLASAYGVRENYIFTFDPATAGILKKHNIGLVNLGNNHILNFKEEGARETEKYLSGAGVEFIGSPIRNSNFQVFDFSSFKVAFISYNQFRYQGKDKALEDIRSAEDQSDLVILYAHWGKEYEIEPLESVRVLAREFIDSGADLIIGSHPHVVQGKEVYKNKRIYYSLGNFIFDQYFQPETQAGIAVRATIDPDEKSVTFEEISLKLQNNGQTVLK